MVDISNELIEKQLSFPDISSIDYNKSGQPNIPQKGKTKPWGQYSSTNSATVLLQWKRQTPAITVSNNQIITEVISAEDSSGNTRKSTVRDVSKFPPLLVDPNPPEDIITYTITVIYQNKSIDGYSEYTTSVTVDTGSQDALGWDSSIANPDNRLVNISLPISTTKTIVSDELIGKYNGTNTTLITSTGSIGDNIHDPSPPNGEITYSRLLTVEDSSGSQIVKKSSVSVNTNDPVSPSFGIVSERKLGSNWKNDEYSSVIEGNDLLWADTDQEIIDNISDWK